MDWRTLKVVKGTEPAENRQPRETYYQHDAKRYIEELPEELQAGARIVRANKYWRVMSAGYYLTTHGMLVAVGEEAQY